MRLIDADNLKERLPDFHGGIAEILCESMREIVDSAPTIAPPTNDPLTLGGTAEESDGFVWR